MTRQPQFPPTPGISPELLRLTVIMILVAALLMWLVGCGVVDAVESFFVSSTEAADATKDAANQAEETLHALQHALLLIPAYVAGEARKPLWGKIKSLHGRRKKKAAA